MFNVEAQQPPPQFEAEATPTSVPAQTVPLAGVRAVIARRMFESLHSMAQLTLHTEADVTELVEMYRKVKQTANLTYTDLFVRACALTLRYHPRLNATLEAEVIRLLPQINIGVAVSLEEGLVVPVLVEADRQSLAELAQSRRRLVERARAGQLGPAELQGGTFTVTNLGAYEIDAFTPIINPPEVAILGIGRIVEKVVIYRGKIAQRSMLTLSLTIDHRLVDGAPGAAFLQTLKRLLEAPEELR
jgi:pyruvate dehydrogenase E2 component (dihydrolipoamide acetyltransferase)